ncbi:hypothetical protein IAQ61_008528 [Plenodomus lingam]|uniref:uncharacterized protein n=1 Tax=Leptosphaeria maculans TaxID=5022 RepID=UPI00331A9A21|nr:hypothetical protein IAQ61_008528 [Plenodomus lingam]
MRLSNILRQSVLLTKSETGETQEFSSMTETGIFLGIYRVTVRKFLLNNLSYKGYTFSKGPSSNTDRNLSVSEPLSNSNFVMQQPIRLTTKLIGVSKEFSTMREAAEYL